MKFIHIADVHLGVTPDKGKPWSDLRREEIVETFDKVLFTAKEENIDLLLIAGDLFHTPPTKQQLKELDYKLSKLPHTRTVIIAGNHDYRRDGGGYDTYTFQSNTICLSGKEAECVYIKELNTCVTGISYDRKEIKEPLYDDLTAQNQDRIQILLAHGGDANHSPINKEMLKWSGFHYIALGHIHKPGVLIPDKMAYAGSLEPIDYTDTGRRGYIYGEILRDEAGEYDCHIKWIPLNKRSYIHLSIELRPEYTQTYIMETLEREINRLGDENIYRILIKGRRGEGIHLDFALLMRRFLIYEVINESQGDYNMNRIYQENQDNLLGKFIETMMEHQDDVLYQKALQYGVEAMLTTGER